MRKRFDWADTLALQIRAERLPLPTREHRFHPVRKWRFDLAWVDRLLYVECDGGEFVRGSLGRHGTARDCEKQNTAVLLGWKPLRFVGSQIRSGYAIGVLRDALR
jgi:very-short-patch-repair endonuclease